MLNRDISSYYHFLDHLPVAALVVSFAEEHASKLSQQNILYVNKRYQALVGHQLSATPNSEAWMELAYPERRSREEATQLWRSTVAQSARGEPVSRIRVRIACADGQTRVFDLHRDVYSAISPEHYIIIFSDITDLVSHIDRLKKQSTLDQLTGAYNQHYLLKRVEKEINRTHLNGAGFTFMMLDLDFFKNVNDRYGHNCGDQVLISCAKIIRSSLSPVDCIARWNGADFVVLMREDNPGIARQVIQKAWQGIRAHSFIWKGETFAMTVTIGLTTYQAGDNADQVLGRADMALKRGKMVGGDFIFMDESSG